MIPRSNDTRLTPRRHRSVRGAAAMALSGFAVLAACSGSSGGDDSAGVTLTLLAYDSFVEPESLATFTEQTGISVEVARSGDTGTLVNKAILTKGRPEGDVLWGLDSNLLSRALAEEGLFIAYESKALEQLDPAVTALVPGHEVTPVNVGDVCLNYDRAWFASRNVAPPDTLEDLVTADYKDLLVVQNPATSSPGLAFLLASVARFGEDGFVGWWEQLRTNGVRVVDSWDTAYYDEFTAGGGTGSRPIVVSYASSPPATIIYAEDPKPTEPLTGSVEASCYRNIEFAGILDGTEHEDAAQQLIDFLVSETFQAELPLTNFVYPVRNGVALPDLFERFARPAATPLALDPTEVGAKRDQWITTWTDTVLG